MKYVFIAVYGVFVHEKAYVSAEHALRLYNSNSQIKKLYGD